MNFNGTVEEATNELQKCLTKWKHDFNIISHSQSRPSDSTSDANRLRILEELYVKGADLNHLEKERGFALVPHVFWCESLINFFLNKSPMSVNSSDENGDTALHLVIRKGHLINDPCPQNDIVKVVKLLMNRGADPKIANLSGKTAIHELAKSQLYLPFKERTDLAKILKEGRTSCISPIDLFTNTLEGGINFRTPIWNYSRSYLMEVAIEGVLPECQRLIKKGADMNARDLQGYTALHHAALKDKESCARYLIKMGADPNAKTSSGKDAYDLIICNRFTEIKVAQWGATPAKQAELYEIMGAKFLISNNMIVYIAEAIKLWKKAITIYVTAGLQPSQDLLTNYAYLTFIIRVFNRNLHNLEHEEQIRQAAFNTMVRLSGSDAKSKFWNLLSLASKLNACFSVMIKFLEFLAQDLKKVEEFASIEETDIESLLELANNIRMRLSSDYVRSNPDHISIFQSIANLCIACFNKLMQVTNTNKVSDKCMVTCLKICCVLLIIQVRFGDAITDAALSNNKGLLKKLIDLDLRDGNCNTLLHRFLRHDGPDADGLSLQDFYVFFTFDVSEHLIELVGVKTKNLMGFEPVQWMNKIKNNAEDQDYLKAIVKMADRGAHVDAKTASFWTWIEQPRTLREVFVKERRPDLAFRYDNLQCACARVLAKSLVPYSTRVPRHVVDFIRNH